MTDWSRTNFDDLEDRSPADEPMRWAFARKALDSPELGVSRVTFEPGSRMPFGHRHREQEELYVVVSGSGQLKLDDELVDVGPNDVLRVAPQVARGFIAGPEGLDVLCVGGRRPDGGDGEPVKGFWD